MFDVKAEFNDALRLANSRKIFFDGTPSKEILSRAVSEILVSEKGYPFSTVVHIDGSDPMALALVLEDNGSWELV